MAIPSDASLAKAPAGPTVTSTNPSFAHRGDTQLSVHVFGSGFAAGAKAQWSIGADTTSVTTTSTTFVSSSELVAVVTISPTAPLDLYDVAVTNLGGKKGVGAELFAVTAAQVINGGTLGNYVIVNEISDSGQIVGYSAGPFITNGNTIISLGTSGQAWGVSPSGDVVVGRDLAPVAWVRQPSGAYVKETLPVMIPTGGGAMHATAGPNGTLVVAGYDKTSTSNKDPGRAVSWTRTGSTWSSPTAYVNGADGGVGWGMAGGGRMLGLNTSWGVWENTTTFVPLSAPRLQAINQAATVAVGVLPGGGPGYWYRNVMTGQWNPTGVPLPMGSCTSGTAMDINDDGVIVGFGCGALVWRVDASVSPPVLVSGPLHLIGLDGTPGGEADAITNTYPYIVAGRATSNGHEFLVKWTVQ